MIHHTEVTTEHNGVITCLTCRGEAFRAKHEWYCDCEGVGEKMDFETWLNFGIEKGYCSKQFCLIHDAHPCDKSEDDLADDIGEYPCAHSVRLGNLDDWCVSVVEQQTRTLEQNP